MSSELLDFVRSFAATVREGAQQQRQQQIQKLRAEFKRQCAEQDGAVNAAMAEIDAAAAVDVARAEEDARKAAAASEKALMSYRERHSAARSALKQARSAFESSMADILREAAAISGEAHFDESVFGAAVAADDEAVSAACEAHLHTTLKDLETTIGEVTAIARSLDTLAAPSDDADDEEDM